MRYQVGTRVDSSGVLGTVIPNFKFPGDICIEWDNGVKCSYDEWWLDQYVEVVNQPQQGEGDE